jgi:hypothetical protein
MKKLLFIKKRASALILTSLLAASLLTGCGKKDDDVSDVTTRQTYTTDTVSTDTQTTEEITTTEEPTTEAPTPLTLAGSARLLSADDHLYDITEMLPVKEGMDVLDIAAEGNGNLLVLYQNNYTTEGAYYCIDRVNLLTGQATTVCDKKDLIFDDDYDIYGTVKFASLDPIVIYDGVARRFYLPEGNYDYTDKLSDDDAPLAIFTFNGSIYANTYGGNLCKYDISTSTPAVETIWNSPNSCEAYTFEKVIGNNAFISGYPKYESIQGKVYFVIDLSTGKTVETYSMVPGLDYSLAHTTNANVYFHSNLDKSSIDVIKNNETIYSLCPSGDDEICTLLRECGLTTKSGNYCLSDDGLVFFAGTNIDTFDTILFWDMSCAEAKTYSEEHSPYEVIEITQETTEAYAKKLSEKFDIDIRLYSSEDIEVPDVFDYDISPESDYTNFYKVLSIIDKCYSNYPDGFFTQLYTSAVPLRVVLANSMIGNGDNTVTSAAGLVNSDEIGDYIYLSTFEGNTTADTVYHETAHVIYNKLCADGIFFDYQDQWDALNPPDFEYAYSYRMDDNPSNEYTGDNIYEDPDINNVYFVSSYSKTYLTEDIATMMGRLLGNETPETFFGGDHIQAKFKLLFEIIRKGFDTTGWPEETYWEMQLQKAYDLAH